MKSNNPFFMENLGEIESFKLSNEILATELIKI